MDYELKPVVSDTEWQGLHALRRATLFSPERRPGLFYDDNHPDDHAANHVPYLLMADGAPIGTVRLDFRGESAVVRLVAITPPLQRQGHGTELDRLVVEAARGARRPHASGQFRRRRGRVLRETRLAPARLGRRGTGRPCPLLRTDAQGSVNQA